jgi:hypothetical protein
MPPLRLGQAVSKWLLTPKKPSDKQIRHVALFFRDEERYRLEKEAQERHSLRNSPKKLASSESSTNDTFN